MKKEPKIVFSVNTRFPNQNYPLLTAEEVLDMVESWILDADIGDEMTIEPYLDEKK